MVRGPDVHLEIPERLNLTSYFLEDNVRRGRGDKIALYYKERTYTFKELCILTNMIGNGLKGIGIEPDDRVLLILRDSPEWVASWYAVWKVGAVCTHAYTYLRPSDYEYYVDLIRPRIIILDNTTLDSVKEGVKRSKRPTALVIAGDTPSKLQKGEYSLKELIKSASDELEPEPTSRYDIAFWNFSGGTTGKPKGVPHTHQDGVYGWASWQHRTPYKEDDIVLLVPKLFFHYAHDPGMNWAFKSGAALVVFPERTTAELIFELIGQYKPTILLNVPTMMRAMVRAPDKRHIDLSSLRLCISAGEALSAELCNEWIKTFGVEVIDSMGSAESYMCYLCNEPGHIMPGSPGKPSALVELKVVDNDGNEVPRGQSGVLMVRCPSAGLYYHRDVEKSRSTFMGNGWINTGDMFREDRNGFFWYKGRSDEMVKISGVWVSLLEIEKHIQEHMAVKECVVLGLKDPDGLIQSKAFIALKEGIGSSESMANEIKAFCKGRLAAHKYPRFIEFMDDLPKTGQGKIDKLRLRQRGL